MQYKEFVDKKAIATSLLTKEELEPYSQSKLKYVIQKIEKRTTPLLTKISNRYVDDFSDFKDGLEIDLCEKDKDGVLLKDEYKEYKFKDENRKKYAQKMRAKQREMEEDMAKESVDFEPFYYTDIEVIKWWPPFIQEELLGFLIDPAEKENLGISV